MTKNLPFSNDTSNESNDAYMLVPRSRRRHVTFELSRISLLHQVKFFFIEPQHEIKMREKGSDPRKSKSCPADSGKTIKASGDINERKQ